MLNGLELYYFFRPLAQPIIGTVHGWFATKMVIIMLFRPYNTYYFPYTKVKIPFTPGIFPSRRKALAINIAQTVTGSLLTAQDIQTQTKKLVTKESIYSIVSILIDTMLEGFQYTDKIQKLANEITSSLPPIINNASNKIIDNLIDDKNNQLTYLIDGIFNRLIINIKLTKEQAEDVVDKIFENIITSDKIRVFLIEVLSYENILRIERVIKENSSGLLKLILFFSDISKSLLNFKDYLINSPNEANSSIEKIIQELELKNQLSEKLSKINFRTLSFERVLSLKKSFKNFIQNYLKNNKETILQIFENFQGSLIEVINSTISNFNPAQLNPNVILTIKNEISRFLYDYLQKELENLVKNGIHKLKLEDIIVNKIENYSSQEIEKLILSIMKRELGNLEKLGAFIGLLLGIVAFFVEYFLPK